MFIGFKNNYVQLMDMENFNKLQTYGPFSSSIDCPVFIDDYCTYIAHLDDTSKYLNYHIMDYKYACEKLPPPPQKNTAPKMQAGTIYTGEELKSFLNYQAVDKSKDSGNKKS